MARAAGPGFLSFLALLLSANYICDGLGGVHSVNIDFTVTARDSAGPRWCEALVQAHGRPLLRFDCESQKLTAICPLGLKVDAGTRKMLAESLKDLMDKLRAKILDLKSDMFPKSGPLSLQGRMLNQVGANGQGSGSLHLSFQGQKLVSFQFEKDTVIVHSEDRAMELQWENASEVTGFLKKFFTGELKRLIDNISEFLEKLPQTTAATSTAPGTVTAPSNAIAASPLTRNNLMKIPILGLAIFVVICCYL